jgi:glutathione synthase/RimK-type ligase-like ATP-grasp enzyme
MPRHVIVVDRREDFPWEAPDRRVVTARDYVAQPDGAPAGGHVINLCRDYSYLSLGYYASLLAEARGQRVIPSVEVMLDLHWKRLLRIALPEVNELVQQTFRAPVENGGTLTAHVFFRYPDDKRLEEAARRIFELFRCPLLELKLAHDGKAWRIAELRPMSIKELKSAQEAQFRDALARYARGGWRAGKESPPSRYSIAILHDPDEALPPSDSRALRKFERVGEALGIEIERITRADYNRLLEFDALFIRETTALDHHTYRFAKKADSEDMPVIDDPVSIMRCTNKIYLAELLQQNGVPTPKTMILNRRRLRRVESEIGFPAVIKIPDGAFSRGVVRVADNEQLAEVADRLFPESDLLLAQEYMETDFDWRVGVLNRRPVFVCQYFMARGHWQIVKYGKDQKFTEGAVKTFAVEDAPPGVVDIATRAASLVGNGLYGVDLKEDANGIYVMEVNDNPNIEAGYEDAVLKDDLYRIILEEFIRRLDEQVRPAHRG